MDQDNSQFSENSVAEGQSQKYLSSMILLSLQVMYGTNLPVDMAENRGGKRTLSGFKWSGLSKENQ